MIVNWSHIAKYQAGELSARDTVQLFAEPVRTGTAWKLQGHYGRVADAFICDGWIDPGGEITPTGLGRLAGFEGLN